MSINLSKSTFSVLKNTNWLLMEKAIAAPLGLILNIILARYLGPELYGSYNYVQAFALIVVPLAALGLNAIVTKELVNHPEHQGEVIGSALAGRLIGSFAGAAFLAIAAFWHDSTLTWLLIILSIGQIFSAFTVFNFWFQSKLRNDIDVKARLFALVIGFTLKLIAIYFDADLTTLVLLYSFDFLLVAVFTVLFYLNSRPENHKLSLDIVMLRTLISQSKWLIMSSVAAVINLKIDIIMLHQLSDASEVGIYSVAARISELWFFIPMAITASYFPVLLQLKRQKDEQYLPKLQNLNDLLLAMAVSVIVPTILFGEFFIELLFGNEYSPAADMLSIHIIGGAFIFMRALLSKWLIAEELLKFSLVTHGIGAIINVAANYFLIPLYGGEGAAWASLLSYAASSYLALFVSSATMPMAIIMTKSLIFPLRYIFKFIAKSRT